MSIYNTYQSIQELVDNNIPESKALEYKSILQLIEDKQIIEFVADFSAFANSIGGTIIYGISETKDDEKPFEITGIQIENEDQLVRQIESIIRDTLEPRVQGYKIEFIKIPNKSEKLLVIQIPKSYQAPHRVLKRNDKFYTRNSAGKHPLNVNELRNAFILSETLIEKIRNFRVNRISELLNMTEDKACYAIHIIPLTAFEAGKSYNLEEIKNDRNLSPLGGSSHDRKPNFDGYRAYNFLDTRSKKYFGYTQIYKNGIIEGATNKSLKPLYKPEDKFLYGQNIEVEILNFFTNFKKFNQSLNVDFPVVCFLTFLNIKNYTMVSNYIGHRWEEVSIDRDILLFDEIVLNDLDEPFDSVLKPWFDSLWNACGYDKCFHYDANGKRL